MGYLISGHFMRQRPSPRALRGLLPPSIGFVVYRHAVHPIFAVDTYRAAKPPRYPFSASTPATDLSLETSLELTAFYERLLAQQSANGFKRAYISLARLLSRGLADPTLSVFTDDDGNDFACLARDGEVVSGVAECGNYVVTFGSARPSLSPAPNERALHQLAAAAVTEAFGIPASDLGFGLFDPPENFGFALVPDA